MSISRNIQITYSGGLATPIQRTITNTGQSGWSADTVCAGSATTTISPPLVLDPDTNVRCYVFNATGNCTLWFDVASGTDTSIALTANTPEIQTENAAGTIAYLPTASDTLTLKVANAGSSTLTFTADMLIE